MLLPTPTTIQSKGRLLGLDKPVVMGILNATPDSFYNKGRDSDIDGLLRKAEQMLNDGAAILDVGGVSTKPGSAIMSAGEELDRVLPVITALHGRFPEAWLSVDTYNALVAKETVVAGASIINDVSSGAIDNDILRTVGQLNVPYIAMHMQGTPETMQNDPHYTDVVTEVRNYLQNTATECAGNGITDIIADPGFGFGKTLAHNFALLNGLHTFRILGKPLLVGLSRKSIVCKALHVNPEHALNGSTALHMVALQQGANILRVHDVKEAMQCITMFGWLQG